MTIDVRVRQAGTLFSMGIEDEAPPRAQSGRTGQPRRAWGSLGLAVVLRGRSLLSLASFGPQASPFRAR